MEQDSNILAKFLNDVINSKLFYLLIGALLKSIIDDIKAPFLNVSDIWQKYLKHSNNELLSKKDFLKFKKNKWDILAKELINSTSQSLWHYPHNHIWLTNQFVMLMCSWHQVRIRLELKWCRIRLAHIKKKIRHNKQKEYSFNVKQLIKSIDEYNRIQQALMEKKIDDFWERGWREIHQRKSSKSDLDINT
jgi:hypothetical protein